MPHLFAEVLQQSLPPAERLRRCRVQTSTKAAGAIQDAPRVFATKPAGRSQGPLTALEEQIEEHKQNLAARNYQKRLKHDLLELRERFADEQRPFPKSATEFARRVKSSY